MKSIVAAATAVIAAVSALSLSASPALADPLITAAACPQASEQLPELLASAMQSVQLEGEVDASFDVAADGTVRSIALQGPRAYRSRVRSALESLDCSGGVPQHYALKIRFAVPPSSTTALAIAPTVVTTAASAVASGNLR